VKRVVALLLPLFLLITTCGAHAVNGAGLGAHYPINLPPYASGYIQFIHTGQSLAVGVLGTPVLSTSETLGNVALFDSSGTYDITNPNAPTLSIGSSAAPVRPLTAGFAYPQNLAGEIPDSRLADELSTLASMQGFTLHTAQTNTAMGGQSMAAISKGGTQNCYAASIYEATALQRLSGVASKAYGVGFVGLTHGEADASGGTSTATYATGVTTLQANYQTDLQALTGQTGNIPLIASQQTSSPQNLSDIGNTTAPALLVAAAAAPNKVLVSGPKYQYTYAAGNVHLVNTAYQLLGEKYAEVYWAYLKTGTWSPLQPTAFAISGSGASTQITIAYNVPSPPLVFDGSAPLPHQSGAYAAWANGRGFEVEDTFLPGHPTNITNTSPIQYTWPSHGRTTGDVITIQNIQMSPFANSGAVMGTFTITVLDANNFTLNGTSAPGATFGGGANAVAGKLVTITSTAIVGNKIVLSLARSLTAGTVVGYAMNADVAFLSSTGGFQGGQGCMGDIHDSDPFTGISGVTQPNWGVAFQQTIN
jgi:hypothetical protein